MADPITREQVERALAAAQASDPGEVSVNVHVALGGGWDTRVPEYVSEGHYCCDPCFIRALTRWRDELAAAEPVRRVARWDADAGLYALSPGYPMASGHGHVLEAKFAQAIAWGYEIEGGPEPVAHHAASERVIERLRAMTSAEALAALVDAGIVTPDGELTEAYRARPAPAEDSPERLRERREALGWTLDDACSAARIAFRCDVERLERESDDSRCRLDAQDRVLYAAALSAEEARRVAKAKPFDVQAEARKALAAGAPVQLGCVEVPDPITGEPLYVNVIERPAPRFKVGDWVRVKCITADHFGDVYQIAEIVNGWHRRTIGSGVGAYIEEVLAPASPPAPEVVDAGPVTHLIRDGVGIWPGFGEPERAPEVVDVPQPIPPVVKRCDGVEACWHTDQGHVAFYQQEPDEEPVDVPIALLRAMLEAIDAQQGGAS